MEWTVSYTKNFDLRSIVSKNGVIAWQVRGIYTHHKAADPGWLIGARRIIPDQFDEWFAPPGPYPLETYDALWRHFGVEYLAFNGQRFAILDYWVLLCAALLVATFPMRSAWRRHRRKLIGHCPNCGYDLRATPDRCPECGGIVQRARKSDISY